MDDIRLALNQNKPPGNSRFYARIEEAAGVRTQARQRGRPRLEADAEQVVVAGQRVLKL